MQFFHLPKSFTLFNNYAFFYIDILCFSQDVFKIICCRFVVCTRVKVGLPLISSLSIQFTREIQLAMLMDWKDILSHLKVGIVKDSCNILYDSKFCKMLLLNFLLHECYMYYSLVKQLGSCCICIYTPYIENSDEPCTQMQQFQQIHCPLKCNVALECIIG